LTTICVWWNLFLLNRILVWKFLSVRITSDTWDMVCKSRG
jgi:hypothetical protein